MLHVKVAEYTLPFSSAFTLLHLSRSSLPFIRALFPSPMSIVRWRPVLHHSPREKPRFPPHEPRKSKGLCPIRYPKPFCPASRGLSYNYGRKALPIVRAGLAPTPSLADAAETEVLFSETFPLKRAQTVTSSLLDLFLFPLPDLLER